MRDGLSGIELSLLGSFGVSCVGRELRIGATGERVVAFLALRRDWPSSRTSMSSWLWPERPADRAAGNLRSVIWRLPSGLVEVNGTRLSLSSSVHCDITDLARRAQRLIDGVPCAASGDLDHDLYAADLLPTWDEDWVTLERERIRQLRIHALDALSIQLTGAGRFSDAIAAGLSSIAAEPLRESAHSVLITAHLAEGNCVEALRQYDTFRDLLHSELGLTPSPRLQELISAATSCVTSA